MLSTNICLLESMCIKLYCRKDKYYFKIVGVSKNVIKVMIDNN